MKGKISGISFSLERHPLRSPNDFTKESEGRVGGYLTAGRARDGAGGSHVESSRDKAVPEILQ